MIVILDVCAAMEVAFKRRKYAIVAKAMRDADAIAAPDLFTAEAANVVWKEHVFGRQPYDDCLDAYRDAISFVTSFQPTSELALEAIDIACRAKIPVYDSLYITLAKRLGGYLLTIDRKMIEAAAGASARVLDL